MSALGFPYRIMSERLLTERLQLKERQLHHQEAEPSLEEDAQKLHPWGSLNLQTAQQVIVSSSWMPFLAM